MQADLNVSYSCSTSAILEAYEDERRQRTEAQTTQLPAHIRISADSGNQEMQSSHSRSSVVNAII